MNSTKIALNMFLPGNIRYQPNQLIPFFGYDFLYRAVWDVELATLQVLQEIGLVPDEVFATLTPDVVEKVRRIITTEVDEIERTVTKHDIRAWILAAQRILGPRLGRWLHVPLTSYDPLDTARTLQFVRTHRGGVRPAAKDTIRILAGLVRKHAETLQIGRTHGQHALPITVGFWLATILSRILYNFEKLEEHASGLVGKISGAVGAYNAQVGLGIAARCGARSFEERVLEKLGLKPARISTQIMPPEPLAYFLFSCCMFSASLAQLGRDCRHLMRSEISEVTEAFGETQVGSSTMAHKRNPINFENLEGMWIRTKNEFGKVLDTLISEHQRDLVGSSVARDFPIILVNLMTQFNTLLRRDKGGFTFLERISIDVEACRKNFEKNAHVILAEPLYIALVMAGYEGDAHNLVNHTLVPIAQREGILLVQAIHRVAPKDDELAAVVERIPDEIWQLLHHPENYRGRAREKALEIAELAETAIARM
ncbi:MAG: hypothetical protein HY396_02295 [Candidatus Doudnabacteria bacterium]|nr:hypothetical protein [Candidatus Doudnabacteria bacterium]